MLKRIATDRRYQWRICCALVWALVGLNVFDGLGMIVGNATQLNAAPEFLFLKSYVPFHIQGAFLILLSLMHVYGMGRRNRLLDASVVAGAVYYSLWAFGVFYSWFAVEAQVLGLFSKTLFVMVVYLLVAWYSPHPHLLNRQRAA